MILGTGIDSVNIDRFKEYHTWSQEKLHKIFSTQEIIYCLSKQDPSPHFAARFAAREAFFKAYQGLLHHYQQEHPATLITVNKNIELQHTSRGLPSIAATWTKLLPAGVTVPQIQVSITHTAEVATALVILEK